MGVKLTAPSCLGCGRGAGLWAGPWELRGGKFLVVPICLPQHNPSLDGHRAALVPSALRPQEEGSSDWAGSERPLSSSGTVPLECGPGCSPVLVGARVSVREGCCNKQAPAPAAGLSPHLLLTQRPTRLLLGSAGLPLTLQCPGLCICGPIISKSLVSSQRGPRKWRACSPTGRDSATRPHLPARQAGKLGPGREKSWCKGPEAGA